MAFMKQLPEPVMKQSLSWWRTYMLSAIRVYEGILRRPLTPEENRALWWRLKYNHRVLGGVGSYTALAIMTNAFRDLEVV